MTTFTGTKMDDIFVIDGDDLTINGDLMVDVLMSGDIIDGLKGIDEFDVDTNLSLTIRGSEADDIINASDSTGILTIEGGKGDDEINSGSGNDIISGGGGKDLIVGGAGEDTIDGEMGDDDIVGDMLAPLEFIVVSALDDTMEVVTFDSDLTLSGADGADEIYGDLVTVSFQATATSSDARISNKMVVFGSEENTGIFGGGGSDTLYGDLLSIDLSATVGTLSEVGFVNVNARVSLNDFDFGNDDIFGEAGSNDSLYGDLLSLDLSATGATITNGFFVNANANISSNDFTFGDDDIWGGEGGDTLYGDLLSIDLSAIGGTATGEVILAFVFADVGISLNSFDFGHDDIWGGDGSDTIYGDLLSLDIIATGGTVSGDALFFTTATAEVANNAFIFGHDDIWGGEGGDTIYGDLLSLDITATGGTVPLSFTSATAEVVNNEFTFGNDDIEGGAGGDTIYGDLLSLNMTAVDGTGFSSSATL